MYLLIRKHEQEKEVTYINLHSIMYLLILSRRCGQKFMRTYLHSIMYLLIPGDYGASSATGDKFTFHNVSINSHSLDSKIGCRTIFTFHNVSINSHRLSHEKIAWIFYLHSIMYLLILLFQRVFIVSRIIYIP